MIIENLRTAVSHVALVAAALVSVSVAQAQPNDTYGYGSRGTAMGGAVTADVDDPTGNYYNPAGLARSEHIRLYVNWVYAHHDLQIGGLNSNIDANHGMHAALTVPGNIGDLHFAFGLGLHLPDDAISKSATLPRILPRWELYYSRAQRLYIAANLAIRPVSWLTIGGGIAFSSNSDNELSIRGSIDVVAPALTRVEHSSAINLPSVRYPQVGIQVQATPELSFGLVYRGEVAFRSRLGASVSGRFTTNGQTEDIPVAFQLETLSFSSFQPQQLSLGGSYSITPQFRINAEVTWLNWSAYKSPFGPSSVSLSAQIPQSVMDQFGVMLPENIVGSEEQLVRAYDRFVPRIGIEGTAWEVPDYSLLLRGGFFYENSPFPVQRNDLNVFDTDRLAWSAGAAFTFKNLRPMIDGWLRLEMHAQYCYLPTRTMVKANWADAIGDYQGGGNIFAGGFALELAFR